MTIENAIDHLSRKITFAIEYGDNFVDMVNVEALEIVVKAVTADTVEAIRCKEYEYIDKDDREEALEISQYLNELIDKIAKVIVKGKENDS